MQTALTGLLADLVGILKLEAFFVLALTSPVLIQLGIIYYLGRVILYGAEFALGPRGVVILQLIGSPIHELSHALAVLLTLGRITHIRLFTTINQPGKVKYEPGCFLTGLAVGVAPLLGTALVLWLGVRYLLPNFTLPASPQLALTPDEGWTLGWLFSSLGQYVGDVLAHGYQSLFTLDLTNWRTYAALYLALSIGTSMSLSDEDVAVLIPSLVVLMFLALVPFALIYYTGDPAALLAELQETLAKPLLELSTVLSYAIAFATSIGVVIALAGLGRLLVILLKQRS